MIDNFIKYAQSKDIYYRTKTEYVAELIRTTILAGEISEGTRIREKEMRDLLGVSSTPVREAFQQLECEGLLSRDTHAGVYVATPETENARELYKIQAFMQSTAVEICTPKLSSEDVAKAEELNEQMRDLLGSEVKFKELRHLNYQLHILLCGVHIYPWLTRIISAIWVRIPREKFWLLPQRPEHSIEYHSRIIEAVKSGDASKAGLLMKMHLNDTAKDIFG